jgi:hypothetical protein
VVFPAGLRPNVRWTRACSLAKSRPVRLQHGLRLFGICARKVG